MATITVNTDGGGDYTSLSAAEASLPGTLTEATTITCEGATEDSTGIVFDSITSATNKLYIQAVSGDEALISGWDNTRYHLSKRIYIDTEYWEIDGLQIHEDRANDTHFASIAINDGATDKSSIIKNCLVYTNENATSSWTFAIHILDGGYCTIENCIIIGNDSSAHTYERGIRIVTDSDCDVYNTLVTDCYESGIYNGTATSCIVYGCGDNFNSCTSITYCGSDATETGTGNFTLATVSSLFEDEANGDFTYLDFTGTGAIIDAGDPTNSTTTDIAGTTRDDPDCGPFEYAATDTLLVVSDCTYGLSFDTFALTQQNVLSMNDNAFTYSIDNIDLVQQNILVVNENNFSYTIDNIDLVQQNLLSIGENNYSYIADDIDLVQQYLLSIGENNYSYVIDDSFNLIQLFILSVNGNNYSYTIDGDFEIEQTGVLSIDDTSFAYTTDDFSIDVAYSIEVDDTLFAKISDNIDLLQGVFIPDSDAILIKKADRNILIFKTNRIVDIYNS